MNNEDLTNWQNRGNGKRRYSIDGFKKPIVNNEKDDWTEEEIMAVAKKILKKLGLPEDSLSSEN